MSSRKPSSLILVLFVTGFFVHATSQVETGRFLASGFTAHYGAEFSQQKTTSGDLHDPQSLVGAHRFLPFGTRVRITNKENGRSVIVRVNDRGPFTHKERIIDVSMAAAIQLDMVKPGVVPVDISVLDPIDEFYFTLDPGFELWTVQVTSVANRATAEHHVRKLGPLAEIIPVRMSDSSFMYRVYYGRYESVQDVELAKQELFALGYANTLAKYMLDQHMDKVRAYLNR